MIEAFSAARSPGAELWPSEGWKSNERELSSQPTKPCEIRARRRWPQKRGLPLAESVGDHVGVEPANRRSPTPALQSSCNVAMSRHLWTRRPKQPINALPPAFCPEVAAGGERRACLRSETP